LVSITGNLELTGIYPLVGDNRDGNELGEAKEAVVGDSTPTIVLVGKIEI